MQRSCSYFSLKKFSPARIKGVQYIASILRKGPYPPSRVSNSYDQPQLPPTKMATAENGETKLSRISGKPDRALCPYDTDMSVSYHTMYFSYDHVF